MTNTCLKSGPRTRGRAAKSKPRSKSFFWVSKQWRGSLRAWKELHSFVFGHFKRELWSENRQPWRRRIRIWEYALCGIAAALLAYFVYNSDMGLLFGS